MEDDNFFVHKPLPPSVLKRLKEKRKRKKRKTTDEEEGDEKKEELEEGDASHQSVGGIQKKSSIVTRSNGVSSIPETESTTGSTVSSLASTVIIEEQEKVAPVLAPAPAPVPAPAPKITSSIYQDIAQDMLPELALRARQRILSKSHTSPSPGPTTSSIGGQHQEPSTYSSTARTPTPNDDDIFDVYVSVYSQIDGKLQEDKPLSFKIRSTHPLSRVKQAWGGHKGISNSSSLLLSNYVFMLHQQSHATPTSPGPISADSVLTQVFDSTTPIALNVKQSDMPYPRLVLVSLTRNELAQLKHSADEKRRKYELLAKGDKENKSNDDKDEYDEYGFGADNNDSETDKDEENENIRLKLLSKHGTIKVRISRKAKVADLVAVLRAKAKAKGQPHEHKIRLEFDAEEMIPESHIQDYDLEDEDTIDVHTDDQKQKESGDLNRRIPDIVDLE